MDHQWLLCFLFVWNYWVSFGTKIHRFFEYDPQDCFNNIEQSALEARRQTEKNPILSLLAEIMNFSVEKSLALSKKDHCQQTVIKYSNDWETIIAINSKFLIKLDQVTTTCSKQTLRYRNFKTRSMALWKLYSSLCISEDTRTPF